MKRKFEHLCHHVELLTEETPTILQAWIERPNVRRTLKQNGLNPQFFGKHFGARVIAYALGVIKGEEYLGGCPVINVMLAIFKEKKISLADLFVICVQLKNTMLDFAYDRNFLTREVLDEICEVFDHNLEGVVRDYLVDDRRSFIATPAGTAKDATLYPTHMPSYRVTSAAEYAGEVDVDMEMIDELIELEHEAVGTLELFDDLGVRAKENVLNLFVQYARVLNMMLEFQQLASALNMLRELLEQTDTDAMEASIRSVIVTYIKAIIDDLAHWRTSVFIDKNAEDIHYLDKTLLSSIAQLEIMLLPSEESGDDAIEFF